MSRPVHVVHVRGFATDSPSTVVRTESGVEVAAQESADDGRRAVVYRTRDGRFLLMKFVTRMREVHVDVVGPAGSIEELSTRLMELTKHPGPDQFAGVAVVATALETAQRWESQRKAQEERGRRAAEAELAAQVERARRAAEGAKA